MTIANLKSILDANRADVVVWQARDGKHCAIIQPAGYALPISPAAMRFVIKRHRLSVDTARPDGIILTAA